MTKAEAVAFARGLEAAGRQARRYKREAERVLKVQKKLGLYADARDSSWEATAYFFIARWCDRRAREIRRGER